MKHYKVGGYVRDFVMGEIPRDTDWCVVGATHDDMITRGFMPVGASFMVYIHPETGEEHALARTKRSGDPQADVLVFDEHVTLEEDLFRRDITMNAMAMDEAGQIIDPFGGLDDIASKTIRHIGDAFSDDPLRILRVARFAAKYPGFTIADETLHAMRNACTPDSMRRIASERIWTETQKSLCEKKPSRYIGALRDVGALKYLFPEIDALFGVPQPEAHHPEIDTGIHVLMALDQACKETSDPVTRFAVLVHDLGKGATPQEMLPGHPGHEGVGAEMVELMCNRLKIPNEYRDLGFLAAKYHTHCHRAKEMRPGKILKVLTAAKAFQSSSRLEKFLVACACDAKGRKGMADREYPQADVYRTAYNACKGISAKEFIDAGYTDGKTIGQKLTQKRIAAIKSALQRQNENGARIEGKS